MRKLGAKHMPEFEIFIHSVNMIEEDYNREMEEDEDNSLKLGPEDETLQRLDTSESVR